MVYGTGLVPEPVRKHLRRVFGNIGRPPGDCDTCNESEEVDPNIQWPPDSEPPAPKPAPCVSSGSTNVDGFIEIYIYYHEGHRHAAEVIRDYVAYTYSEAWGDRYKVYVSVVDSVPTEINSGNEWADYSKSLDNRAKDCNHLVGKTGYCIGGGSISMCGNQDDIGKFYGDCVREYGSGDSYGNLSSHVHEVGHALGLTHEHGGQISIGSTEFNTPMRGNYKGGNEWIFRLHPEAKEGGPDVK